MTNLIDWISFTLPVSSVCRIDFKENTITIPSEIRDMYPHVCDYIMSFPDVKPGKGRKMFDSSIRSEVGGFNVFWRDNLTFSLFEFSGVGCAMLRKLKFMHDFIRLYGDRMTRIDVATDLEVEVKPEDFVKNRSTERFTSFSIEKSETGYTHYVGSKTSDRFARVYCYNEGHPRSGITRVEHVVRNDEAKQLASIMAQSSLKSVVSALGNTFGWTHAAWTEKRNDTPIKAAPRESHQGSTERWLFTAVIPAIRRLIEEGGEQTVALFGDQVYAMFNEKREAVYKARSDTLDNQLGLPID